MGKTAPKPPAKGLLVTSCLIGGATLGMLAIVGAGHFIYGGVPANRLTGYAVAMLIGYLTAATLAGKYLVQKCRRDSWWEGHAALDDPEGEAMPLRRIKAELEELTEAVFELANAAGQPRPFQPSGSTYASRAFQNDTIPLPRRLPDAGADSRVQLADRQQADPEAEARAQGYAEGYVDGIARRAEGDAASG